MCELDDFGVHDTLNAADEVECRCNHEPPPPVEHERWREHHKPWYRTW